MEKVQDVHDYSEGLHASIQYTLCPTEDYMDVNVPSLDITPPIAIPRIQSKSHFPNLDIYFSPEEFPTEFISITINDIQSKVTTPEEQSLVHFNRINLKILYTWYEWEQGERNKINPYT